MYLKNFIRKIQHTAKNCISNNLKVAMGETPVSDYESSIIALNNLQSNAQTIKMTQFQNLSHSRLYKKSILESQKYLIRSGMTLETLDTLSVIHVTGTKGKGTVCALCESILRHHGLKTGFYSSPHLIEVRERIRINGKPLSKNVFAKYFWQVYNQLESEKENPTDMPMYFQFLTIVAFNVFVKEKVDVAVIEVGIGGEYDATNILRNVAVVGINSVGTDHVSFLGNSRETIAWNKAGIMKPNSKVFTVPQKPSVIKVFKERSFEKRAQLNIIEPVPNITLPTTIHQPLHVYELNLSLALNLCEAWMTKELNSKLNLEVAKKGISKCQWPGRYQILKRSNNTYYLDGAHTLESLEVCVDWFKTETKNATRSKALIFNATGNRNAKAFLSLLQQCNFKKVYFVPNKATSSVTKDTVYLKVTDDEQIARCYLHRKYWSELENSSTDKKANVKVFSVVSEALEDCQLRQYDVLVTGSLILVGAALSVLNPNVIS